MDSYELRILPAPGAIASVEVQFEKIRIRACLQAPKNKKVTSFSRCTLGPKPGGSSRFTFPATSGIAEAMP
jgi:hypothetical protein